MRLSQYRRFQVRFSLRFLLIFCAIISLTCWGYWIAWPWWQVYCDQLQFEASVKQIKSGDLLYDVWGQLERPERGLRGAAVDANGNPVGWIQYEWPTATYLIYCPLQKRAGGNPDYDLSTSVEVFRLDPMPSGYMPQTPRGQAALPDHHYAYTRDFFDFIAGDRSLNPGFQFERIHADAK